MTQLLLPLRDLMEYNLACYVKECGKAKPNQTTLNGLEKILKDSFQATWHAVVSVATPTMTPHLYEILLEKDRLHESAEFAMARFVLKHRYPKA